VRDELVPLLLANQFLQRVQKGEALLIRYRGKAIIRVNVLEVSNELGELMFGTKLVDRVCECLPANDGRKVAELLAMHRGLYASF
jgi:antitoxin (DNA-binding transcriptional repressor) of toxin-antitoxin stability system